MGMYMQALYDQGILTIVDMHQDFYSRWLNKGCGEGFPRWSINVDPLLMKPPLNGWTCAAWILQGPFDVIAKLNWHLFYAGEGGVRDRFLDMWEYLARESSSHRPLTAGVLQHSGMARGRSFTMMMRSVGL